MTASSLPSTAATLDSVVSPAQSRPPDQISLVDLLDRLLGSGVVLAGDVVISLSGVDLVQVRLHALITSVRADMAAEGRVGKHE